MESPAEKSLRETNDQLQKELIRKNRELEIEAALERVRVRAMRMHDSSELAATSSVLFHQLKELQIAALRTSVGIFDDTNGAIELWITGVSDNREVIETLNYVNLHIHPVFENLIPARKENKPFALTKLSGSLLKQYYQHLSLPNQEKYNEVEYYYSFFFPLGTLNVVSVQPLTEEQCNILIRFASVFGLVYRRFLDLQKAEGQTREAKVESALERVRSVAMNMQESKDLLHVCEAVFKELHQLGFSEYDLRNVQIVINNDEKAMYYGYQYSDYIGAEFSEVAYDLHPVIRALNDKLKQSTDAFADIMISGSELDDWRGFVNSFPQKHDDKLNAATELHYYFYSVGIGALGVSSFEALIGEQLNILQRLRNVFDLCYKRYSDITLAAAQAREAKIEAALERIRARALAMHSSSELMEVADVLREQMALLGQPELETAALHFYDEDPTSIISWRAFRLGNENEGMITKGRMAIPKNSCELVKEWLLHFHSSATEYTVEVSGTKQEEWYKILFSLAPEVGEAMTKRKSTTEPRYYHFSKFTGGALLMVAIKHPSEESIYLQRRAASVFDLAYRRFLDLQHAEEQAREAKIEAALERVRSKALAMHKSDDLAGVVGLLYTELTLLDFGIHQLLLSIYDTDKGVIEWWSRGYTEQDLPQRNLIPIIDHLFSNQLLADWRGGTETRTYNLEGEVKRSWDEYLFTKTDLKHFPKEVKDIMIGLKSVWLSDAFMKHGSIQAAGPTPLTNDKMQILKRFTRVVDLAYTRMVDLQHAEASTREAVRQASLDRVRAEIASMRTTSDLEKITPLIWRELTTLGIPFIRCGVFIMDEDQKLCHSFLSTPDGKAIAAVHMPYTSAIIRNTIQPWRDKQVYTDHWDAAQFVEFWNELAEMGAKPSQAAFQIQHPPENLYLHFLPFLQGMLYAGNTTPLAASDMDLLQSVAEAFSTAYARYEDFNKLETAKQQVEKTLTDLKQAQSQLVQSEKMASLGELTAGIAHEIQNPLNFVNNFSEVSNELLDEMTAELAAGKMSEAVELANDVKQNLEKILHHGKRADSIVKGMLQHSRASSGQKELTDINALADEYLRLAFHGLRAKDKSFNAAYKTDFDSSVGKINVLPQDIGRAILNLLTNAFYAVGEKRKTAPKDYEPAVTVSSKRNGTHIEIRVSDNGNGIPQKVLDKIFQPFFTTKPTGQGTGLGLSLSYEIITKGHQGELNVETREGEGSEFIVRLPSL